MRLGGCQRSSITILGVLVVLVLAAAGAGLQLSTVGASAQSNEADTNVAFTYVASSGNITLVTESGNETDLGGQAEIIGEGKDVDGDSYVEIPYITSGNDGTGTLYVTDKTGKKTELASEVDNTNTKIAIGDHDKDGNDSVYFVSNSEVKAVNIATQHETTLVGSSNNTPSAVAGVANITSDETPDVVYYGDSGLGYYNTSDSGGETTFYSSSLDSNNGLGIGAPRDFDRDGTSRVPIVGSNNVKLVNVSGGVETWTKNGGVGKSPVAGVNWTDSSNLEVIYLDTDGVIRYVTEGGTSQSIDDISGDAAASAGVAWVQDADAPLTLSNFTLSNKSGTLQASFDSNSDLASVNVGIDRDGSDVTSLDLDNNFTETAVVNRQT